MLFTAVAGCIGLVAQAGTFVLVVLVAGRPGAYSRAVVAGGVLAVYGWALLIALGALLRIPWQAMSIALAIALVVIVAAMPRIRTSAREGARGLKGSLRAATPGLVIALAGGVFAAAVAVFKPELSIDGQLYHGPALAQIVRSGSLWDWPAPNQYLFYSDLTMAGGVDLASFTGRAVFDDALQVPHLLLLAALINWALLRRFSSSFVRMAVAAMIVTAPVIWIQARILYVDLAYGTAVAAAILLVALVRRFAVLDVLVVGVSVAAIFATKPTGILTGLVLLVVAVVRVALSRRRRASRRQTVVTIVLAMGAPLVAATSFYVRNLVQFGNPVYPVRVDAGPLRLPGIIDLSVFASGDRGSGLVDPSRWLAYLGNMLTGVTRGVIKPDYDPRAGGYGFMPLAALAIVVLLIVAQLLHRRARRGEPSTTWRAQAGIAALAAGVILIQPASFDSRYVIGPTVVLVVAAFLTGVGTAPSWMPLVAGVLALAFAAGQVVWTERFVYPGLWTIKTLAHLPADQQPSTPGDPWGRADAIRWLPDGCTVVALQTAGGVGATGLVEKAPFATFPYALYGDALCNEVIPARVRGGSLVTLNRTSPLTADYVVAYTQDVPVWQKAFGGARCLVPVGRIGVVGDQTQSEVALRVTCR